MHFIASLQKGKVMNKLSAIIIAKNEEENIIRCLASLENIIDDAVVIVDSSTLDKTYENAIKFSFVNCEKIQWQGFAKTKIYALSKTKHDWVLWIDADEELTDDLKKELLDFKNSTPQYYCYDVARRAYFLGKWIKHSGWYPNRIKRLFDKTKVTFDDKNVHEGLLCNSEVGHLKNDLNHYTDPNIYHYIDKLNNYTTLAVKDLLDKNKKITLFDIILRPISIFIKMYIIKFGFLDGIHGFILATFSSFYVYTKYVKLWEVYKK